LLELPLKSSQTTQDTLVIKGNKQKKICWTLHRSVPREMLFSV